MVKCSKDGDCSTALELAVRAYGFGDYETAVSESRNARGELETEPARAVAGFVEGLAWARLCEKGDAYDACRNAGDILETAEAELDSCAGESSFIGTDASEALQGYTFDCNRLRQVAAFFKGQSEDKARFIGEQAPELVQENADELRHTPSNTPVPILKIKGNFSDSLAHKMRYSPELEGTHYVRRNVFDSYDPRSGEWISRPSNLTRYTRSVIPTHEYKGPLFDRKSFDSDIFDVHTEGALLPIPIPDGFVLDASTVRIDGSREGFEIVEDDDGVIYVRTGDWFNYRPEIEFAMRWEREPLNNRLAGVTTADVNAPDNEDVVRLLGTIKGFDAENKYLSVQNFIQSYYEYPDWFNWKTPADCDVSNAIAVLILKRAGVPARLVTGYLIDERGVGLHGWLEYWDPSKGRWVRGDVTPPLEGPKAALETDAPKQTETDKVIEEVIANMLKGVPPGKLDLLNEGISADKKFKYMGFKATSQLTFSRPSGRYLIKRYPWDEEVRAIDLETGRKFMFQEGNARDKYATSFYESVRYGLVLLGETNTTIPENNFTNHELKLWAPDGRELGSLPEIPRYSETNIYVKRFPNLRRMEFRRGDAIDVGGMCFISGAIEDEQGTLHVYFGRGLNNDVHLYYATVDLMKDRSPVIKIDVDKATLIDEGTQYAREFNFSADGRAVIFTREESGEEDVRYVLVRNGARISEYKVPNVVVDSLVMRPQARLNSDGSFSIERSDGEGYYVRHFGADGREDVSRGISISPRFEDPDWYYDVERGGVKEVVGPISRKAGESLSDFQAHGSIRGISSDETRIQDRHGAWISLENRREWPAGHSQCILIGGEDKCIRGDHNRAFLFINNFFDYFIVTDNEPVTNDLLSLHYWSSDNGGIDVASDATRAIVGYANGLALYIQTTTPEVEALDEFLDAHSNYEMNLPKGKLAGLLAPFAWDTAGRMSSDLAIRAIATMLRPDDAQIEGGPVKLADVETVEGRFLKERGPVLARRFLPLVAESVNHPNIEELTASWAFFIAVGVNGDDRELAQVILGEMMFASPYVLADAIIYGIETGLIDYEKFPEIDWVDRSMLAVPVRAELSRRKKLALETVRRTPVIGIYSAEWVGYQRFERRISEALGSEFVPDTDIDW